MFLPGDHPRACGEHLNHSLHTVEPVGSSPRLRGTLQAIVIFFVECGIIPALAGNTSTPQRRSVRRRDHPRACGEHILPGAEANTAVWIIPALAGNTSMPVPSARRRCGSSPRLRGTRMAETSHHRPHGIIPALAGNTRRGSRRPIGSRDHPRACGEHKHAVKSGSSDGGSSPRLRGTQAKRAMKRGTHVDHPRACGEHPLIPPANVAVWGSSPRLRGTHNGTCNVVGAAGIIPALAGNT